MQSEIIIPLVKIALVLGILPGVVLYLVLLERKVAAWIQDRLGPNRIGPLGLGHAIADALKLLFKEDVTSPNTDKALHRLAPIVILIPALCTIAVVPFGDTVTLFGMPIQLQIADVNIGILYVLAVASLGVYGVVLAGWASNSKYAFLGGIRSAAQLLSYEVPLGLSLLGVVLLSGHLELNKIAENQAGTWFGIIPKWNVFLQPIAFLVFLICAFAETNRAPFDIAEAEQELVAGYHTEYSSIKWVMFFLAEYANMIVSSAVMATLFFGGWHFPYISEPNVNADGSLGNGGWINALIKIGVLTAKIGVFIFVFMWVRWTLPRFRFDQLMGLAWKVLVPIAMVNLMLVGLTLRYASRPPTGPTALPTMVQTILFVLNILGFVTILFVIPWLTRKARPEAPGRIAGIAAAAGAGR